MVQEGFQNTVKLRGVVAEPLTPSHTAFGEEFFSSSLAVPRTSGYEDRLPVTLSGRVISKRVPQIGDVVTVIGQLRSYNQYREGANRLILTVFAKDLFYADTGEGYSNYIALRGHLCKAPVYRTTPFGREIADLLLAVNRAYQKSDYIPCIAWGRTARQLAGYAMGMNLSVIGRFQSREYEKQQPDGDTVKKTAYEVSVITVEKVMDLSL